VQRNKFLVIKPTWCTNFTNSFCHETLHISESFSVHHQEFIHCTLSNFICRTGLWTALEQDQDVTAFPSWSCSKAVYKPVRHIPLLSVQWINSWWLTEELSETFTVSWQIKFVKLVHLFGFIIKKILYVFSLQTLDAVYREAPIVMEYELCRKYAIANGYMSQCFFSEVTVFIVHTHCFFKANFQPYPYFLSGLLIAVRWAFFIPTLLLYSLFSVVLRPKAGVDSLFLKFMDHTQRRFIVGRTPLDEWSAGRRDLYLTTHNTHNRKTSMPLAGFKSQQASGRRPTP